jgi:hypothetical protein
MSGAGAGGTHSVFVVSRQINSQAISYLSPAIDDRRRACQSTGGRASGAWVIDVPQRFGNSVNVAAAAAFRIHIDIVTPDPQAPI